MIPSLSVRIAEPPRDKTRMHIGLGAFAWRAREAGFDQISLRASAVDVETGEEVVETLRRTLARSDLGVSMVTGNLSVAANDTEAPAVLRDIEPHLRLARRVGAGLVRVMAHRARDIAPLRAACDAAAAVGIRLAQQCHWGSLAETVDEALSLVEQVDHPAFGITYEPANLIACGSPHGADAVEALAPHLVNVYFQNVCLDEGAPLTFATRRRGAVGVRYLPLGDPGGVDAGEIIEALRRTGYDGPFTVHQPLLPGQSVEQAIAQAGGFVRGLGITPHGRPR